jgi:type IV pili sensor histidine kinase/response regulator
MCSGLLKRKSKILFILLVTMLCGIYVSGYADTQIGRYSTVANKPTTSQVNPLLAVAQYKFPPQVESIGDAVNVVLQNTSYELVPTDKLSTSVKETLKKPLPITDRSLGPMPIKDVLVILMGKDVFTLVVDPLHRLVNFEVKPRVKKALSISDKKNKKEVNKHA